MQDFESTLHKIYHSSDAASRKYRRKNNESQWRYPGRAPLALEEQSPLHLKDRLIKAEISPFFEDCSNSTTHHQCGETICVCLQWFFSLTLSLLLSPSLSPSPSPSPSLSLSLPPSLSLLLPPSVPPSLRMCVYWCITQNNHLENHQFDEVSVMIKTYKH